MYEDIILTHYSHEATLDPQSKEQKTKSDRKPQGLWVSVEGEYGWREWGMENEYGCFDHRFSVTLAEGHKVLITDDLIGFHRRFKKAWYPDHPYSYEYIQWEEVAREYQGIVIPTYHWEFRFDTPVSDWYYGWDCASGCIWDAAAIASVTYDSEYKAPENAPDMSEEEIPF